MRKALFLASLILIFVGPLTAQKKWRPFAGLHVSGSADLYYLGPSYSAGVIHTLGKKQRWSWVPELTYFYKSSTYEYSSTLSERDRFEAFSIRSTFNYQFGKKTNKGLFVGAGIGFQKASDECWTITDTGTSKEENMHYDAIRYGIITASFNTGYTFPLKKGKSIQVLVSAIGPYTAGDYLGTYVEVISVLSLGARFIL
jgi:hypothetical protein